MPTGILEVKLGRPLEMPERRFRLLLEDVRRDCCRARNAAMTHWFVWRREHPDWQPGGEYHPPPRRIKRTPAKKDKPPKDPPHAPREFLSRELYQVASSAVPTLNTSVLSTCCQEVNARLRANTPYNHDGEARYVWQAILSSEVSLPTWRNGRIPLPRSVMRLRWKDDGASVRIPLVSKQSPYRVKSPEVRLLTGDLTKGNQRLFKRLATGDLRVADSQVTERQGKWFVQLCYQVPIKAVDLPKDRVMVIKPGLPDSPRPFMLTWANEDEPSNTWGIGNGKPLVAQYRRVQARRRSLRARYSDGCGSGHGRQRWYKTVKPMSRYVIDMCSRFAKQTVSDIVQLAIREQCGTVMYREPTMPVRGRSWFASEDVPMDWVAFEQRLSFKCETHGLEYDKKRIGMAEWRPKKDAG